ncbi:MAG TPA: hypothetical protein PKY78_06595 [Candidatus Omnitrophota bacterium]|nr:hypothetical protein [Candidatus Omnitrophota bacterium]HPS20637.1 hypothetical protein [Candidatus Omnitrophota bacterium]
MILDDVTVELLWLFAGIVFILFAVKTPREYRNRAVILRTFGAVFMAIAALHCLGTILNK